MPKPAKAEAWSDPGDRAVRKDTQWLDTKTEDELGELDDEFDDDRFLDEYRRVRGSHNLEGACIMGVMCEACAQFACRDGPQGSKRGCNNFRV